MLFKQEAGVPKWMTSISFISFWENIFEVMRQESIDESNQKLKDYKDLKERLAQEKENNDDLENDLKQKDEEINLLKMHVKAKVNELEQLEVFTQERIL